MMMLFLQSSRYAAPRRGHVLDVRTLSCLSRRRRENMDPIVSVIIISYNCAEYISKAIESCLSQSCKNIEIIIGDDGSTDNSKDVIDEYISKYPKVIKCYIMERPSDERNIIPSIRVSKNIKRALQYAKGKYIRVMSADDYYEDKFLFEKQLKILEANNEYSSVTCGYRKVWPDGKNEEYYPPRNINSIFWSGMYVHVSCLLIRQEVLKGRYLLPRLCDDTGLLYSAIISGKCLGMPSICFVLYITFGCFFYENIKILVLWGK